MDSTTLHSCTRCGFTTNKKAYLLNHLRKKTACAALLQDISVEDVIKSILVREPRSYNPETQKYACNYCKKEFATSNGRYQHGKRCHVKNAKKTATPTLPVVVTNANDDRILALEKQIQTMQQQIASFGMAINNTSITNTNISNSNNNINNNITIVDFGKENLSSLTPEFMKECLLRCQPTETLPADGINGITKLLTQIYSIPENKNVRLRNRNQNLFEIFADNHWLFSRKKVVLDSMVKSGYNIINKFKLRNKEDLEEDYAFEGIMEEITEYLNEVRDLKESVCSSIKDDLYIMLINDKKKEILVL